MFYCSTVIAFKIEKINLVMCMIYAYIMKIKLKIYRNTVLFKRISGIFVSELKYIM